MGKIGGGGRACASESATDKKHRGGSMRAQGLYTKVLRPIGQYNERGVHVLCPEYYF